jgi:hypothetical protein
MSGKQKFELWREFFRDLLDRITAAYVDGATVEEANKGVPESLTVKYAAKFAPLSAEPCR